MSVIIKSSNVLSVLLLYIVNCKSLISFDVHSCSPSIVFFLNILLEICNIVAVSHSYGPCFEDCFTQNE